MGEIIQANYEIDWRSDSWKLKKESRKPGVLNSLSDVRSLPGSGELIVDRSRVGEKVVSGYAAIFNVRSVEINLVYRVIKPGCFRESLQSGRVINLLIDHEPDKFLASTRDGSLKVEELEDGLYFEWFVPGYRSEIQKEGLKMIEAGCGASFGYQPSKNYLDEPVEFDWHERKRRALYRCEDLIDVSLTLAPNFPQTRQTIKIL